jgi:tetratricopeptide (TPR) repeat protein
MWCSRILPRKCFGLSVRPRGSCRRAFEAWPLLPLLLWCALPAAAQDSGSVGAEFHGNGAEITVVVHDSSGELIPSVALVKLFRGGTIPSGQAETSRGRAELVVNSLGDFTVLVEAAGYSSAQKEFSVDATGRTQIDIVLRRTAASDSSTPPGRPLLAPKAQKAVDEGLRALSADKTAEAEKHVAEAVRLAPGHPDVLYLEGVLYLKQHNWAQAQEVLQKATQLDPGNAQAFAALGMSLCDQGKYDAAIAPLEKALQLNPASAWDTRWTLAKAYYRHEQYDEALKLSEDALTSSNGKAPEIALLVAQSLTAVGRYEDAAETLRVFLRDHGDRPEAATARRWLDRLSASGKIHSN